MKISVVIPVYKVECFIGRCAESLFSQTLSEEVEFIFVDDATPDKSIDIIKDILKRYPERMSQVRIVSHENNKGLPEARNTGLSKATGEYIFHCDSDDFIESDMLESLYDVAKRENADFVWSDWFLTLADRERIMSEPTPANPEQAVKLMLSGAMKFNVWNKLVRRNLYTDNKISFPKHDGMGEDMTMILLCAHSTLTAHVARPLYHYVKTNTTAFSNTYSDLHLNQLMRNVDHISEYLTKSFGNRYNKQLIFLKLDVKLPFLLLNDGKFKLLWKQWYPEANAYIWQNKEISMRTRLIQWLASKNLWFLVDIYSFLLNKLVYGR